MVGVSSIEVMDSKGSRSTFGMMEMFCILLFDKRLMHAYVFLRLVKCCSLNAFVLY